MTFSRNDRLKFMRVMDEVSDCLDRFELVDAIPDLAGACCRGRLDDGREMAWTMPNNKWFITRTGSAA